MMNQYLPANPGFWGALSAPLMSGATSYWGGQGGKDNQGYAGQSPSTMGPSPRSNSLGGQVTEGY